MASNRIAFLGPFGTFGHEATESLFPDLDKQRLLARDRNQDIVAAVIGGSAQYGVAPILNSSILGIGQTWEPIHQAYRSGVSVYMSGVFDLTVRHNLIGCEEGVEVGEIRRIITHPAAYDQCYKTLAELLGNVPSLTPARSTADAVECVVAEGDRSVVAIGSLLAAELHSGVVIHRDIHDLEGNYTRFAVLSLLPAHHLPTDADETLIMMAVKNKPGGLVDVLIPLKETGVNATNIVLLPTGNGENDFAMALGGHETVIARALDEMRSASQWLHVLGSYPVGMSL